jgi:branched-chain amino acid transport system permease protein
MSSDIQAADRLRRAVPFAVLALLGAVPVVSSDPFLLRMAVLTVLASILLLGLNVVTGFAGQVSLCQAAFYGIGAYASGIMSVHWRIPMPLSIAGGAVVSAVFAFLLGASTLRLRSHYLALATIGFGEVMVNVFRSATSWTGGANGLSGIPTPAFSLAVYYWIVLATAAAAFWVANRILHSQVGLAIEAMREDELAAESVGVNTRQVKIVAFATSGFLAGLAGALYAHLDGFIGPESFSTEYSILLLCAAVVGGLASIAGSVLAALLLVLVQEYFRSFINCQVLLFGLTVIVIMMLVPGGASVLFARFLPRRRFSSFRAASDAVTCREPDSRSNGHGHLASAEPKMIVSGVSLNFGGVQALREVSFEAKEGKILCLVGPNGAGKTTMLNVMHGFLVPGKGGARIRENDRQTWRSLPGMPLYQVAKLGLRRVFQHNRVFKNLTCFENVLIGFHLNCRLRPTCLEVLLRPSIAAAKEQSARRETTLLLRDVGLWEMREEPATLLPFGAQRMLELARAAAARPDVLLLDEPSAGLAAAERTVLVELLRRFRKRGLTLVMVAHDLDLVREVADQVVVLSQAQKIFDGLSSELNQDRRVVEAFLGMGGLTDARS